LSTINTFLIDVTKNGSQGLNYKQFIGVMIPSKSNLNFDQLINGQPVYSCEFSNGSINYSISAVPAIPGPVLAQGVVIPAEKNILYCRLDESVNVPLKVGSDIIYTLTIKLTSIKISSTNFLRNISLFTATSNNPEKTIIDSIPVLGSLALYSDSDSINSSTTTPLIIESGSISVTSGPSASTSNSILYPHNIFNLSLNIKSNSILAASDHNIIIKFPSEMISSPSNIKSYALSSTDKLQYSLSPLLDFTKFGQDGILLTNINEDLVPNRKFQIVLNNIRVLDSSIDVVKPIELYVYYKNTYSVISYHTFTASNLIKISKIPLTLTANHPEFWDIYRNGAWPITFTFKSTNNLINGGYVVIQQSNTLDISSKSGNKLTFIASTCDFSANDSTYFDNSFGGRPSCFPLRMDFNYPNASTSIPYKGSGIFFYIKSLQANRMYSVTVWAFADICSGSSDDSFNPVNGTAAVIPTFTFSIYKNINPLQTNEDRFTKFDDVSKMVILGQSDVNFSGNCFNAKIQSTDASSGVAYSSTDLNKVTVDIGNIPGNTGAVLFYREFYDWQIVDQTSRDASCLNCWGKDISISANFPGERYFYSDTSSYLLSKGSYFMAKINIKNAGSNKLALLIPNTITTTDSNKWLPGHLVFQFPSAWFTNGDPYKGNNPSCYASWAASDGTIASQKTLLYSSINGVINQPPTGDSNFFAGNSSNGNQIDTNSLLPPDNTLVGANNILRLISTFTPGDNTGSGAKWKYFKDFNTNTHATNNLNIGYFTTCVKWTSTPPLIKSLFTYIDVQISWNFRRSVVIPGPGVKIANTRLIKLFPEGGVFQDFSKNTGTIGSTNPFTNHVAYTSSLDSLCLIELNTNHLINLKDSSSNTLVLFIMFGSLIESDYSDASSSYPAAPLYSDVTVYGLTSSPSMTPDNLNISNVNTNYSNLNYVFKLFNASADITTPNTTSLYNGNYRTPYLFYLGSVIYITGVKDYLTTSTTSSISNQSNLLIPYYCPLYWFSNNIDKTNGFLPTIVGSWITSSSFTDISSVNRFITYNDSNNTNSPFYNILANKYTTTGITIGPQKGISDLSNFTGKSSYFATLKFNPYTSLADNTLYVFNGSNKSGANNVDITCTGHILLLSSNLNLDNTITTSFNAGYSGTVGVRSNTKVFYVFGKAFNKAILYGLGTSSGTSSNMTKTSPIGNSVTSTIYFTGVKRPNIDSFLEGNYINSTDKIAYFCASAGKTDYNYMSNYLKINDSSNSINNFILDWNANTASSYLNINTYFDTLDVFKQDFAGNFKFTFNTPKSVPGNSQIVFKSANNFNVNTICGMMVNPASNNGNIVTECLNNLTVFTCTIPSTISFVDSFSICCYNLIVSDNISLSSLSNSFPVDSRIKGLSTFGYITSNIYSADTQISSLSNPFSVSASNINTSITTSAKISKVFYSHVNQESGIGKVTFMIELPREVIRDMKITINGDLGALGPYAGFIPRCNLSFNNPNFSSSPSSLDVIFDTCSTANFYTKIPITIITKKIVYKCGMNFSKIFYITLSPVNIIDWNNLNYYRQFSINIYLNSTSDNLQGINFVPSLFDLKTSTSSLDKTPKITNQLDNLCAVSNVNPRIPGEKADYDFVIDLFTNRDSTYADSMNEVSIFWPIEYFGSYLEGIECYNLSNIGSYNSDNSSVNSISLDNKLICAFSDDGILNIKFSGDYSITGKKTVVRIINIPNPVIEKDISFICTINYTTLSKRLNIITGSGKLPGGINYSTKATIGSLRFLNLSSSTSAVSNNNPRNTSTHIFRVSFDKANILNPNEITIDNYPVLIINFPSEYNFLVSNSASSNSIIATIDEYTSDSDNNITKTNSYNYMNFSLILSGNRITVKMFNKTLKFSSNFRYLEVKLENINNPSTTYLSTKPYVVTFTNTDYSSIFTTYSNVNTYAYYLINNSNFSSDNLLNYYRGFNFAYDNNKFVIDINSNKDITNISVNNILVKAGRYSYAYITVRPNDNLYISPSSSTVSLNDKIFGTSSTSYTIVSAHNSPTEILIGCPCNIISGSYIIFFSSSNTNNFTSVSPVTVTVDNSSPAILSFQNGPKYSVSSIGSAWVGVLLSEPNFDMLKINFSAPEGITSDSTAKITGIIVPSATSTSNLSLNSISPVYATFSINSNSRNSASINDQIFKASDPNSCFSFSNQNTITFTINPVNYSISGVKTSLNASNLINGFQYFNADIDKNLKKNSIKFNFTTSSSPLYLYCALICYNSVFPADADIISPKIPNNSNLIKFYSNYVNNNLPREIVFPDLIRGESYKLRCIAQSTETDLSSRTSINLNIENSNILSNSTTMSEISTNAFISPSKTIPPQCVQFNFYSNPNDTIKNATVNYCQKLFSEMGWSNNGCVVCMLKDNGYKADGLTFNSETGMTCPSSSSSDILRLLQTSDTTTQYVNVTANSSSMTLCAIPSLNCPSDPNLINKSYSDYMTKIKDNLKTKEGFKNYLGYDNVYVDLTNPTNLISDSNVPDPNKITLTLLNVNINTSNITSTITYYSKSVSNITLSMISNLPLSCYYLIAPSIPNTQITLPSSNIMKSCKTTYCGTFEVDSIQKNVTTLLRTPDLIKSAGNEIYTYYVYFLCSNNIPFTKSMSDVKIMANFTIKNSTFDLGNNTMNNLTFLNISSIGGEYIKDFPLLLLFITMLMLF
jgi:hypothetical protein